MKSRFLYVAQVLLTAVLYFAAAKLALALAIPPGYATAVWPSSGIALAALLLLGWNRWPGVWAGAALVNFTIQYSAPLAAAIATGNTLEAVIGAVLLRRAIGTRNRFERGEHVVKFVAVIIAGCAVAATVATLALQLGGFMPWRDFSPNWWTWWQGDVAGIIILTPLLLSWAHESDFDWSRARIAECAIFAVLLFAVSLVVFGDGLADGGPLQRAFLLMPFVIWAAFRFPQRVVTTANAVMCGIAVWQAVLGEGLFAAQSMNTSLLTLQAFMATVVVTGLVLSAVLDERRLAENRLRSANEDLETFVHVAAHDLQEPLRTVINMKDLLERRHGGQLDKEAREYLDFIESGTKRMRRILSDLLDFAQIDRKDVNLDAQDCARVLANVLDGLRTALTEAGATVTHDPLPTVTADGTLLELLFQNLIANSVKFRGVAPLSIHIGAHRRGREWLFSVRDNGIGIDPAHFREIFEMFQRLHGSGRYPGTGIGLTICKKIVERHDGRIWVESQAGKGATFLFTIPER